MKLSPQISIDSIDYASQGNAILGIRNSGKSYTGTYIAERLMDDGIPFIAFDPIGIWRYLKVGKKGAGYPVVVAGDNGDLPLTPQSAPDIVRAAMKENVSLVVDLYSMGLSKADWRKIVEQSIRLLLYENKPCGLRHIFIEEAAEFCPQRVQSEDGRVYAEIEKLARMGGNASLGYTLINQRAEEVNKAVLELCDCLFLHRQKGRHSLTALGKWLDVADTKNAKAIINSLPSLEQGECWVWQQGSHDPARIQMPQKKTVHPDRKNPLAASAGIPSDVSKFVARMNKSLSAPSIPEKATVKKSNPMVDQSSEVVELRRQLKERDETILQFREQLNRAISIIEKIGNMAIAFSVPALAAISEKIERKPDLSVTHSPAKVSVSAGSTGGAMRMLKAVAMHHPFKISLARIAALSRMSPKSGSFNTHMATLKREGWVLKDGGDFFATKEGLEKAGPVEPLPKDPAQLVELWCDVLGNGGGAARILRALAGKYPKELDRQSIGETTGMSSNSGSFNTYLATLKRNGLIISNGGMLKAADELYK